MAYSYLANEAETREVIDRYDLVSKHRLGQNFLVDDSVIGRILGLAELTSDDVVLEVGPGIGTLTVALLPRVQAVCSIEADAALAPVLEDTCEAYNERLTVVVGDALRMDGNDVAHALVADGVNKLPNKLVSNLPYQVAATVILRYLGEMNNLERAVVMVQAEVADRIAAKPNTKAYGAYTIKLALLARVTGRFEVGSRSFLPAPHVDSAVVRLDRERACDPITGEPLDDARVKRISRVVDAAFAQRRKTILNSLSSTLAGAPDKPELAEVLTSCGISPTCRAETLPPEAFVRLEQALTLEQAPDQA